MKAKKFSDFFLLLFVWSTFYFTTTTPITTTTPTNQKQIKCQCFVLIAMLVADMTAQETNQKATLNVPEPQSFNDQSALSVKSNLQSQQYQDFIHTLYRFDKDNLNRVNTLFQKAADRSSSSTSGENQQPSYADYIQSQQPNNYIGTQTRP